MTRVAIAVLATGLLASCSISPARTLVIVPSPPTPGRTHVETFSRAAAEYVESAITERGFAAILPDAEEAPESVRIVEDARIGADMTLYVWVQQVEIPTLPGEHRANSWGGLEIVDARGRQLAYSASLLDRTGVPSKAFFRVAGPGEPRGIEAARECAAALLLSMEPLANKVR